ncbi:hypothetical protein [Legionella fairfieldensis]|uniref:hypothetical protein n=1 Tax=Legionella fairfieldensis TaxID=45064 RepID=UPI00048E114F|nr:hypothetical protein [Legionella fairfieldensis]
MPQKKGIVDPLNDEIHKIIDILDREKFKHQIMNVSRAILGLMAPGASIFALYYGIYNTINWMQKDAKIADNFIDGWYAAEDNTCWRHYGGVRFDCPSPVKITIELCSQLVMTYCNKLKKINAEYFILSGVNLVSILLITFGVIGLLLLVILTPNIYKYIREKREFYSHLPIPQAHQHTINRIINSLSISMTSNTLHEHVQELKNYLNLVNSNKQRRLTFFSGTLEKNKETALHHFLKKCDREILYKILVYADPFLPHFKKFLYPENENTEHTLLLSEIKVMNG